eukprot:11432200-Karenia_brevis.AAC.1
MQAGIARWVTQSSPWRSGEVASALFQLSRRSVWRRKVLDRSLKAAPGGRARGMPSALFKLSC